MPLIALRICPIVASKNSGRFVLFDANVTVPRESLNVKPRKRLIR